MEEMTMFKSFLILCAGSAAFPGLGMAQAEVRVEPVNLQDSRPLQVQTQKAAIRDYLQSWQSLKVAFEQNRTELLDPAFVGTAKEKLTATIQQQAALGIRTRYQDQAHVIRIVFYSPEGLSIELMDKVEYEVQVLDHEKVKSIQHMSARYVIVLTPAEVRWRVRIFQAAPE